jgi:hypothetical protein
MFEYQDSSAAVAGGYCTEQTRRTSADDYDIPFLHWFTAS